MNRTYLVLFIIWTLILFTLTSIPRLSTPIKSELNVDKLAHLLAYLLFAWLYVKMHSKEAFKWNRFWLLAAAVPLFDELHQIPIPGRAFSIFDLIADILGFVLIYLYFRKKKI